MPTNNNDVLEESALKTVADWSLCHGRYFRANIIIWGMHKHYSTFEVSTFLADADFKNLTCSKIRWKGDHLHIVSVNDSKAINQSIMSELSAKLRKIGCRCILVDRRIKLVRCLLPIACFDHFCSLNNIDMTIKKSDCVGVPLGSSQSCSARHCEYGLRVGSWNFFGFM